MADRARRPALRGAPGGSTAGRRWHDQLIVVAGAIDGETTPALYLRAGTGRATPLTADLADFNPEATFTPNYRDQLLLLSDDGTRLVDGAPGKELEDKAARRFRGRWLRPTPTRTADAP